MVGTKCTDTRMTSTSGGPHPSIPFTESTDNSLHEQLTKKFVTIDSSIHTICKLRLTITSFQPQPNDRM